MECGSDFGCKIGDHCVGGFCKPQKDFCKTDGDCSKDQCCVIKGNGERGGVCKSLRKPGDWCPLKVRNSLLFLIPDTRQYCEQYSLLVLPSQTFTNPKYDVYLLGCTCSIDETDFPRFPCHKWNILSHCLLTLQMYTRLNFSSIKLETTSLK